MDILDAIVLGLVEGITEYLPVSSTGHLILASELLGVTDGDELQRRAVNDFNIVIQGGAILAVLGLYRSRVWQMIKGLLGRDAKGRQLAINIVIAFLPAAILGVLFNDLIDALLFRPIPVLIALALGGVWMIWLDRYRRKKRETGHAEDVEHTIEDLTWKQALGIGCFQVVAMWPGTSRSMMTIAGGTLLGLRPKDAAEFSFLLGLPTLGGACVYKLAGNLKDAHETGQPNMFELLGWTPVVVGIIVATLSAALAVKWLVAFLTRHGLAPFGWYRLALTVVMGALITLGVVSFDHTDPGADEVLPTPQALPTQTAD